MKTIINSISLSIILVLTLASCGGDESKSIIKPTNYTIILDLSDRILSPEQFDKDIALIETTFKSFEKQARKNLVISSKDRFNIKIIPQKNSPLNVNHYEDLLQLYLDEKEVSIKNNSLVTMANSLHKNLENLKKDAFYGKENKDYFGVDIWAYLHDNGQELSKKNYVNKVVIITDGYFDFESQEHVIHEKNRYTSTNFLNKLKSNDWEQRAVVNEFGLLPIQLDKDTHWIVAGICGKKATDILQTEKITYFWEKWLKESGVTKINLILNGSKTSMCSNLIDII